MFVCVRNLNMSLSLTLSKNEKVEQHIRKKTHKSIILRFWVEGGVIPLCLRYPPSVPSIFSASRSSQ